MWQNWALLLCYMIQAAQKVSSHPDVPLLMQADLWEPVYEPKGSRTATCPACLVNMLRLCGPSDLPTDTIHMCVSITLGNCSQGTAPQMIWAGSELYRMEEMKQRPDKQHLDDNAHTHTHTDTHNICNVWSLQAVSLSYIKGNTVYLCNQETVSLSNTESDYNEKPDDVTLVYIINTLLISTDVYSNRTWKNIVNNKWWHSGNSILRFIDDY